MKKFFKWFLIVLMHLAIAAGLIWTGLYIGAICDDIVTSWSIEPEYMAVTTAVLIAVYWLKKGTKKLEA